MIGRSVGHYEVVAKLGEGGMGEVYRARDMQLGRDVAIKVLRDAVAADPDRLMRFEREARTLAALNHPHIAQVYGLETSGHSRAIVMELVDGEDLAERIRRGALPLDEAIAIARQIADALETAHDAGIVHRDLKPANVRVTRDGRVKVLDFGLAKALGSEGARATSDAVTLPTLTSPAMTQAGIILGTAAYMAPEQARGRAVDRRADLWALGCVLYEMLSATRPFDGETTTDVLSAVVSKEPDWSKLPQGTPPAVSRLLRRCLRKDARLRLQSAGDARVELDDALAEPTAEIAAPPRRAARARWLPALAFTAAGAAIAVLALSVMRPRAGVSTDPPAMRFTIALPPGMTRVGAPEISPDGRWIAIPAMGPLGQGGQLLAIWLRAVDGDTFRPIAGTEVASAAFWSPDSRELAFARDSALFRIPVAGGTPVRIAQIATAGGAVRGAWRTDGTILVSSAGHIHRVPASGGTLTAVTSGESAANYGGYSYPSWLPVDRVLFSDVSMSPIAPDGGGLYMQALAGGAPVRLLPERSLARQTLHGLLQGRFTTTARSVGTISAHRFDVERASVEQPGVVLADGVDVRFSASDTGVLVYKSADAEANYRFQWLDANGQPAGEGFDVSGSGAFNLSRDERLIAFQDGNDVMVRDVARGVTTRVVEGPGALEPILSPDGQRLVYSKIGVRPSGIALRPTAGGAEEMVFTGEGVTLVEDWSRDGQFLLAIQGTMRSSRRGVIITLGGTGAPVIFAEVPAGGAIDEPRFSPDGKWIVYNAAEDGRQQVYLVPVPPTGERWQLSTAGGAQGRWRADGGAIFYLSASGQLMEVNVSGQRPPKIGAPRVLFATGLEMSSQADQYAPSADGKRFLLRRPAGAASRAELYVIVNWPTLLKTSSPR
jgi:Tol biopolymer transport system component/tRNA A-37 threonylcarbamoyl transferase component Bud32